MDYSFVEYAGSNIAHWSFLDSKGPNVERLCGKLILVSDADGETKMERKVELRERLKDRYVLLDVNEIENILSLKTIKKVLESYEDTEIVMPQFTSKMPHKGKKIGQFIEEKFFPEGSFRRKGGYKSDSGTVKAKLAFCNRAITYLDYDQLSDEAISLCKTLYDFVSNQKELSK